MKLRKVAPTTSLQAQVVNTYNTSDTDTYSCEYINEKLGEVIYSSTSGTSGDITLDKSVADYDEIEIYYHSADNIYGNTGKIPNANNKRIVLSAPFNIDTVCYNKYGIVVINNKSLTYYSQFETHIWSGNNGINTGIYFYIDKVVGYKLSQATAQNNTRNLQQSKKSVSEDYKGEEENFEDIEPIENELEDEKK